MKLKISPKKTVWCPVQWLLQFKKFYSVGTQSVHLGTFHHRQQNISADVKDFCCISSTHLFNRMSRACIWDRFSEWMDGFSVDKTVISNQELHYTRDGTCMENSSITDSIIMTYQYFNTVSLKWEYNCAVNHTRKVADEIQKHQGPN